MLKVLLLSYKAQIDNSVYQWAIVVVLNYSFALTIPAFPA